MKKLLSALLILALIFSLSACGKPPKADHAGFNTAELSAPAHIKPELPQHSPLYIPDLSVEDVILYFNEVCLDSEIINSGDPSYVQKWVYPVYYILEGSYTDADLAVLSSFTSWLNTVPGFPGIYKVDESAPWNMRICFCNNAEEMADIMGPDFYGFDGAVTFWYAENMIYDATISYRTDIPQYTRNSVIIEEIYNGLGPIQDTSLREDSIIYSGFSEPQWLTPIDELIIRLLYSPDIEVGMNAEECEQVIRTLYY
ncbi:MAG: DUF2927 domain-containing protein [Oscillospiraceae bacterium]|nr:DUF2927 domain-containing protein [Oscillospiraceae bacterium]